MDSFCHQEIDSIPHSVEIEYNRSMNRLVLGILFIACSAILALGQTVKRDEISVTVQATTQVVTGSVLHMKGAVQITTNRHIIRADEADFNIATGDIEARGNVQAVKIGLAPVESVPKAETLRTNIDGKKATFTVKGVH